MAASLRCVSQVWPNERCSDAESTLSVLMHNISICNVGIWASFVKMDYMEWFYWSSGTDFKINRSWLYWLSLCWNKRILHMWGMWVPIMQTPNFKRAFLTARTAKYQRRWPEGAASLLTLKVVRLNLVLFSCQRNCGNHYRFLPVHYKFFCVRLNVIKRKNKG